MRRLAVAYSNRANAAWIRITPQLTLEARRQCRSASDIPSFPARAFRPPLTPPWQGGELASILGLFQELLELLV